MRIAVGIILALIIMVASVSCNQIEKKATHTQTQSQASRPFPKHADVISIHVFRKDGTLAVPVIQDADSIADIAAELGKAVPSHFEDPEMSGARYWVELRSDQGTTRYELNDLRGMGSNVNGKIYPENPNRDEVWSIPAALIRKLAGDILPQYTEEPLLYFSLPGKGTSINATANRSIDRQSVEEAIERTFLSSLSGAGEKKSAPVLRWLDEQSFEVIFPGLAPGKSIRLSFADVISTEGESFGSEEQLHRNEVVIFRSADPRQLRWIDTQNGQVESDSFEAEAIQKVSVEGENTPSLLLYREEGEPVRVRMENGEQLEVRLADWPDPEPPFGNDYGQEMLFADRMYREFVYVAVGNRTLYRLNYITGQAEKIYASPKAIYGLTSSPDGGSVALLTSSDDFLGPQADLVIVDSTGKQQLLVERAAYSPHSDGFLFRYPMTWTVEDLVVVPSIEASGALSYASIQASNGALIDNEVVKLSGAERGLLEEILYPGVEVIRMYRHPEKMEQVAVELVHNTTFVPEVWLLDPAEGTSTWVGAGCLLGWTEDGRMLVADLPQEGYNSGQVWTEIQ